MDLAVASSSTCRPRDDVTSSTLLPGPGPAVAAHYRLDLHEHTRRQDEGLRGVTSLSALDTLLTLPIDVEIPVASLAERTRRIASRLPVGTVTRTAQMIRRLARPPLRVDRVTVYARSSWSTSLYKALEFSQLAERALLCSAEPTDEQVLEASYHGVGVAVRSSDCWTWLVEPAPFVVRQHSAARWAFAEKVYEMHLSPHETTSAN